MTARDTSKERLRQFARDVAREVCVRTGDHKPDTDAEREWAKQGVVEPDMLDSVTNAFER